MWKSIEFINFYLHIFLFLKLVKIIKYSEKYKNQLNPSIKKILSISSLYNFVTIWKLNSFLNDIRWKENREETKNLIHENKERLTDIISKNSVNKEMELIEQKLQKIVGYLIMRKYLKEFITTEIDIHYLYFLSLINCIVIKYETLIQII